MSKLTKVTKKVKVPGYSYQRNGKTVKVKGHTKKMTVTKQKITKAEYKKKFDKRSAKDKKRDRSRTAHKSLVRGNTAFISPSANSQSIDWLGVDAKGHKKIPAGAKVTNKGKGLPKGYTINQINTKDSKSSKYRAKYNGKPIGPTNFSTSYKKAKDHVSRHHGRRTGKIKNVKQEESFEDAARRATRWSTETKVQDRMHDKDFFDKSQLDDSLYYTEKRDDYKSKFSMRNQEMWGSL